MWLNAKQKRTVNNLKKVGITEPLDIIKFCVEKLDKPNYGLQRMKYKKQKGPKPTRTTTRKYSKRHYQGIINYLAQMPSDTAADVPSS